MKLQQVKLSENQLLEQGIVIVPYFQGPVHLEFPTLFNPFLKQA